MAPYQRRNPVLIILFLSTFSASQSLPTLYEFYTEGGITTGLSDKKPHFTLNSKNITIFSGSIHYFRVPKPYWRDRLRKCRAAGLNAVQTYVPWNLHEPQNGVYDFGNGGSEFEDFLDLAHFLDLAKQEDLFVILRPGPYICAELEFGGLPSWLLTYPDIKVRTSQELFMKLASRYLRKLLAIVSPHQFTKGGAVIAVQIENEYGNTKIDNHPVDTLYLELLKNLFQESGIVELLFTSDTPSSGFYGTIPGVLATANFQNDTARELTLLRDYQPGKPLMVAEYWTGYYDHWAEGHKTRSTEEFGRVLEEILGFGASVNMYMFHGGTNWGFLNGADVDDGFIDNRGFQPVVTTYDYDAPVSESGSYTPKYFEAKAVIARNNKIHTRLPTVPETPKPTVYPPVTITTELTLENILKQTPRYPLEHPRPMETLPIHDGSGQSYGYVVYRALDVDIPEDGVLEIVGHARDTVLVLVDGELVSGIPRSARDLDGFGFWRKPNATLRLAGGARAVVELVVENWGRVNYGKLAQFAQHKGLGEVRLDGRGLGLVDAFPVEFGRKWSRGLRGWRAASFAPGPKLYRGFLEVGGEPRDTYVDARGWGKGVFIVNGFVLGRYFELGPQMSLYLPACFLREGTNEVLVFEHFLPARRIEFSDHLIFV